MRPFSRPILALALTLGACARSGLTPPSLAPRPGELVDPRLPVEHRLVDAPVSAFVRDQLAAALAEARSGDGSFQTALGPAQRAAEAAGAPQSEGWIRAQQLLSGLEAARAPTARAVGNIDAIAGERVKANGGISASDRAAIEAAAAEAGAIDRRQTAAIAAIETRLAR